MAPGSAIATFDESGRYGNLPHGNHAAIFLGSGTNKDGQLGIRVLDQFEGRRGTGEVMERFYPFGPSPNSRYLAGDFSVIE